MNQRSSDFQLTSSFQPAGDQPKAISSLISGLNSNKKSQTLLGVTGSGKTFTMANVIQTMNRPALIMCHNKILAAQLYEEMKGFFPKNAVEYFVSYYDYYQPEAYIPHTDTFIEKDSAINDQIDQYRHSATRSLLERRDVIVVASISCIYGLGLPEHYYKMAIDLHRNKEYKRKELLEQLVLMQYERNEIAFERGCFRVKGDIIDIFPSHSSDFAWRLLFFGNELEEIVEFDPFLGATARKLNYVKLYPKNHFVTPQSMLESTMEGIKTELQERLPFLRNQGKIVEAQRLEQRTKYDLELIQQTGFCKGIENYSRYTSGRQPGQPPATLFEYLPKDGLLFVDESHVSVPQIRGMFNGDQARKQNLIEFGFRLPSALDNRPLKFDEWDAMRPQTIFVSATPAPFELLETQGAFIEQIIRPTGLLDPECFVRSAEGQVDDLLNEIKLTITKDFRILVTTLTKKMSEELTNYLKDLGIKVGYLHSEVDTLERIAIIKSLREGVIDVLVGVNLLREGLDIPECALVAILDADKEGFLRSESSLIQTIGRAARNSEGKVVLYADKVTASMAKALAQTEKRRAAQIEYNHKHGITPTTIIKRIHDNFAAIEAEEQNEYHSAKELETDIEKFKKAMLKAAADFDFEKASYFRDRIKKLNKDALKSDKMS